MSKRSPNGRSSIYEGKDGRWHGWVTMGVKPNGAPDRRHRTAATETEVTRKVQKLEAERDAGNVKRAGRPPTMAEWMTLYLDTIASQKLAPSSLRTYRNYNRNWITPHLGKHRIDQLEPEYLDALYAAMFAKGRAVSTVTLVHNIIYRALTIAMKRRKVTRNVTQLVELPPIPDYEIVPYTTEEARQVITEAHTRRNGHRWSVALTTGPRQGEVLGLRWKYLDLDTGEVQINWQIQRLEWQHGCDDPHACGARLHRTTKCAPVCARHVKTACPKPCPRACTRHAAFCPQRVGGHVFRPPKGKKSRTVVLPPELLPGLRAHRAAQLRERVAAGEAWQDNDLVFCRPDGRPIDSEQDRREWKDILTAAGVRHIRVHDGRHTAGTLLIEQQVHIRVVQELLGHASLKHTQRYTHVAAPATRAAAAVMGTALLA